MPKRGAKNSSNPVPKRRGKPSPRIAANGHRLPDPLPKGEILTDVMKCKWKLGKSIGLGGFGEIYLASDDITKQPGADAEYVVKIEHHSNGPLFAEMHFYHRVGKADQIQAWMKEKKLSFLGMPRFIGSGSHEHKNVKYRFMVMERFGEDLQKLLERNNRVFPVKTVYTLGRRILDILEYIHSYGYIHADVKASNLLSGFGKGKQNQVHLVDFGLACKYISDGKHKEYKEDLRKAHDGTIEFTSRDAHIGAHSRRGDLEILGYNMLQWLCGRLPWEDNLKDPEYVSQQKTKYMQDIPLLITECFQSFAAAPKGIAEYLSYVASLKFDEEPDYELCRNILKAGIKACGFKDDGKLVYRSVGSPIRNISSKNLKRPAPKGSIDSVSPNKIRRVAQKMPSESSGVPPSPQRKIRRVASATPGLVSSASKDSVSDSTYINPTPAMLLVMQRKLELQQQQQEDSAKGKTGCLSKNNFKETVKAKVKSSEEDLPSKKRSHSPRSRGATVKKSSSSNMKTRTLSRNFCFPEL